MRIKYYPFLSFYIKKIIEHFKGLNDEIEERVIKCENFDIMEYFEEIESLACEMGLEETIMHELEGQFSGDALYEAIEGVYEIFFYTLDCVIFDPLQREYEHRKLMEIMGLKMLLKHKGITFGSDGEELFYFLEFL